MRTLDDYAHTIVRIQASTLTPAQRHGALTLLAARIDRCAWQPWARQGAQRIAAEARCAAAAYPTGGLDALNSLAGKAIVPASPPEGAARVRPLAHTQERRS